MSTNRRTSLRASRRIALLIPHTDVTLETDLQRELPAGCSLAVERMWLDDVTEDSEKRMLATEAPRAARYLRAVHPELGVFGCTSASALFGPKGEQRLVEAISKQLQCPVISAFGAVLARLGNLGIKRTALFTPYVDSLTERMAGGLRQCGLEVVHEAGMMKESDVAIGETLPEEVVAFVLSRARYLAGCDAVVISCTNLRALEVRSSLERELGLPVVTSNSAILEEINKRLSAA